MAERDIQSLVESAYAEAETASADAGGSDEGGASGASVGAGAVSGGAEVVARGGGTDTPGADTAGEADSAATAAQRARDKAGRFAPKGKEAKAQAQPKTGGEVAAPASVDGVPPLVVDAASVPPPAPVRKAPQSWTPAEREHFAKAPPEVQAVIERREREAAVAIQEAAPAKRFQQEVSQAFQPYAQFAQSIGTTPMALAQQASQVAMQISTAPPHMAAQVLANLVRSRPDMTLEMLAQAIDAGPQQQQPQSIDPAQIAQQAEQRVWQRIQGERQEKLKARFTEEVASFAADPKNEFFSHEEHGPAVQARVLGLIQATSHLPPKEQPSLSDIYDQAVWAHPATRAIMQKRADVERAKATTASTQQARLAASSVKSAPSTGASSLRTPKTDRERVAAAYDTVFGGG